MKAKNSQLYHLNPRVPRRSVVSTATQRSCLMATTIGVTALCHSRQQDFQSSVTLPDCATCKIKIDEGDRRRHARIQPLGFWTDVVKVHQSKGWGSIDGSPEAWGEIEIGWGAGGADGTLSGIPLADSFIHALYHAKLIAERWTNLPAREAEITIEPKMNEVSSLTEVD